MMTTCFSGKDYEFMRVALEQAQIATSHQDVPVGAVLVDNTTGEIVAVGHNTKELSGLVTGHAEINVIQEANKSRHQWRLSDCTLYVTLEPCPMCTGAILASRIPTVICAAKDPVAGAMGSVWSLHQNPTQQSQTKIVFGCMAEESRNALRSFFEDKRV